MFGEIGKQIKSTFALLIILTLLTGFIYPMAVTAIAQLCFKHKANGHLLEKQGKLVGSLFIGQSFTSEDYIWGRPSATQPFPYNGQSSSGSNSGPSNPNLWKIIEERAILINQLNLDAQAPIPVELITASASGLDPDISPSAAYYQAARIARTRHLTETDVRELIAKHIKNPILGFLGEPRVNVLMLNLSLDQLGTRYGNPTPKP